MSDIVRFEFEGVEMMAVTYKGRPAVIAKEFGRWLGYSGDGGKLPNLITGKWSDFFESEKHYVVLDGKELSDLKSIYRDKTPGGLSFASRLMLLFTKGMYKVAFKSGKPEAEPLIDYVVDRVFPQLEIDGKYDPDREVNEAGELTWKDGAPGSFEARERELALRERETKMEISVREIALKERALDIRERKENRLGIAREGLALRNAAKLRLGMGRINDEMFKAQCLKSWELEAGGRVGTIDYDGPVENGKRLSSPLEIAKKWKTSKQRIGKIVTEIGDRLGIPDIRTDERYVSPRAHRVEYTDGSKGHPNGYLPRANLTAMIEEVLAEEKRKRDRQMDLFGKGS